MNSSFFDRLFSQVKDVSFRIQYWDGTILHHGEGEPEFTVVFHREPQLLDALESPSIFFGESYMRGDIELSGSYEAMAKALNNIGDISFQPLSGRVVSRALSGVAATARSLRQQKEDIAAHYDLGNEFFSLWLDSATLSYSCAYFRDANDCLDQAQRQKTDLVLRKLFLKPGMRVLDIGCGWGWLSLRAAEEYGVEVLAVTLSEEQHAFVSRHIAECGLEGRVAVRLCNCLDLGQEHHEQFDRVVSVGMFEHVGQAQYEQYFALSANVLKPGGLSLLHTLTKLYPGETNPWIKKYIFPGGNIPTVAEVITPLSRYDFHLLHAESLRRHYARTLRCWYEAFSSEAAAAKVRAMFDEQFVRMWGLYLRMAAANLQIGSLDVHQFVFSKGVNNDLPLTLESVYAHTA